MNQPLPRPHEKVLMADLSGVDVPTIERHFRGEQVDSAAQGDIQAAWELLTELKENAKRKGELVIDLSLIGEH